LDGRKPLRDDIFAFSNNAIGKSDTALPALGLVHVESLVGAAGYEERVAFAIRGKEDVIVARVNQRHEIRIEFYMSAASGEGSMAEILEPAVGTFESIQGPM
jgi:hypothetical protein